MSGGIGSRFGSDCPKQYSLMNNRMVIDYVIDACRKTKNVDEVVIVTTENYIDFIAKRYNLPTIVGGATRPRSVSNGLKYIHENYDCEKVIITNAVCPLATSAQYDKYFNLLDEYDYVLTTWKLAPALHRFDGNKVDRDDFFNVMEPDAYRFKKLYNSYDCSNEVKYIFHNMPDKSKPYYCFDYPFTMKLTHPHDLKLLRVLYNELIIKPQENQTLQVVNKYLSSDGTQGIEDWISYIQESIQDFVGKYQLTSYSINTQTEANIVYEAYSQIYGDIIVKFTPSKFHFHKEVTYYKLSKSGIMAEMIDSIPDYNALVLKMMKPGFQVRFDLENIELSAFFDRIDANMISLDELQGDNMVPNVASEFEEYVKAASNYTFEIDFRSSMERKARIVWKGYFENAPKYYLHRDLHKRNLLYNEDKVVAIDPRGAVGPKAFEYVIQFIIELRDYPEALNEKLYNQLLSYFSKYVSKDELNAALFIFWIYKMDDYVFQKSDNFKLAKWCKKCILDIYFKGISNPMAEGVMPNILKRFS